MSMTKTEAEQFITNYYNLELKCTDIAEFDETREWYINPELTEKEIAFDGKYQRYAFLNSNDIEYCLITFSENFHGIDNLVQEMIDLDIREYKEYVLVKPQKKVEYSKLFKIEPYYVQGVPSY